MKRIVLLSGIMLLSLIGIAQNCARIINSYFTGSAATGWHSVVEWNADGQKYIDVKIYSGAGNLNLVKQSCIDINCTANCSGTEVIDFTCSDVPHGILVPNTGTCGNGTFCGASVIIGQSSASVLPIIFSEYTAQKSGNVVFLQWKTEKDNDISRYDIESSSDGVSFKVIGSVQAKGNINSQFYSYADNTNTFTVANIYRIKIVNMNGSSTYSDLKVINGDKQKNKMNVYPNPSTDGKVSVIFDQSRTARKIIITDLRGRLIKKYDQVNSNNLQINNLLTGVYTIEASDLTTGEILVNKIVVNR